MGFEVFEHTADLGLRAWADTGEALFAEAGLALMSLIVANPEDIRPVRRYDFDIGGGDVEYLLFDWLNALLYHFETEHALAGRFDVRFVPEGITATALGEPLDRVRHRLEREVKAITYHGLKVIDRAAAPGRAGEFPASAGAARWLAEVIVDI